jgi:hypothetical protein
LVVYNHAFIISAQRGDEWSEISGSFNAGEMLPVRTGWTRAPVRSRWRKGKSLLVPGSDCCPSRG